MYIDVHKYIHDYQFIRVSAVMMSLAWFGLVKNGHCKQDRANRNRAGPLGVQSSGPARRHKFTKCNYNSCKAL